MYSVWFVQKNRTGDIIPERNVCFLTDIPSYAMAARVVCRLEELFGVTARIEKD